MLERRLAERSAHSRFEHEGSSAAEARLYDELAATVLPADGFTMRRIDTGHISAQEATEAIVSLIGSLSSPP